MTDIEASRRRTNQNDRDRPQQGLPSQMDDIFELLVKVTAHETVEQFRTMLATDHIPAEERLTDRSAKP